MPDSILATGTEQVATKPDMSCHVCGRASDQRIALRELPAELAALLQANAAATSDAAKVCARCIELFSRAKAQIDSHHVVFESTDHVLPTPLRMDADERFTGRGVTIAFLDSGFYPHDDLTKPENRIIAYHSIFDAKDDRTSLETTDVASWHGMMTSVVAAGNGHLSEGFYRGIAPAADRRGTPQPRGKAQPRGQWRDGRHHRTRCGPHQGA
jgi:serine protease AprX